MTKATASKPIFNPAVIQATGQVRVFVDALGRLGYDVESLLHAVGMSRAHFDDPDGRVPCEAVSALFGQAMQRRPTVSPLKQRDNQKSNAI